ncbi:MAG TPA: hypothetical protein VNS10_04005 [Gemmatimonadaceae bacterium]|jgi:hypothetical protein|nr:hypothetical protein [Gemmatimonadaceae bacterium]
MITSGRIVLCLLLVATTTARAQSIPGAVLARNEPHHHLAYQDSTLRVLRVRVPAHDTTLLHEHDPDYFWIALGASTVTNAKLGAPDATISSADLSIHYTAGNFAHVARNPGTIPFDNITVELLEPQTAVRNLCEAALADKPLDCRRASQRSATFIGATEHSAFATAKRRVSLVTIPPNAMVRPGAPTKSAWLIALDTLDVAQALATRGLGPWIGGTIRLPNDPTWRIQNRGGKSVRFIAFVEP